MNGIERKSFGESAGKIVRNILDNLQNRGVLESTIQPELSNLTTTRLEAKEVIPLTNEERLKIELDKTKAELADTQSDLYNVLAIKKVEEVTSSKFTIDKNKAYAVIAGIVIATFSITQFINTNNSGVKTMLIPGREYRTDNNIMVVDEDGNPRLIKVGAEIPQKTNQKTTNHENEPKE